jgi:hypothetical protein
VRTVHDIRHAFCLFKQNHSTTAIAFVSIAHSVAATTVVFVAIKSVLITPLKIQPIIEGRDCGKGESKQRTLPFSAGLEKMSPQAMIALGYD